MCTNRCVIFSHIGCTEKRLRVKVHRHMGTLPVKMASTKRRQDNGLLNPPWFHVGWEELFVPFGRRFEARYPFFVFLKGNQKEIHDFWGPIIPLWGVQILNKSTHPFLGKVDSTKVSPKVLGVVSANLLQPSVCRKGKHERHQGHD